MSRKHTFLGGACVLALAASVTTAQTTVEVTDWAFLPNYAAAAASDADTNSPTFTAAGGDMAWGGKFQPMDISEVDSLVTVTFTLTADGGITGGNFRLGLFNDNGQLQAAAGDPPAFGGAHTGFTGYLWALSAGGNAPGSNDGEAGSGTITALVAADEGNWVSTYRGYSVVPEGLPGPGEGASEDGGTFDVTIELYRLSADALELGLTVTEQGGGWEWTDTFRVDDIGGVPAELSSVNLIAFADLSAGADIWQFADVQVEGVPDEGGEPGETWLGYSVNAEGWADTGSWLGNVWVSESPWVWSDVGWIWVAEDTNSEAGAWVYAIK